MSVFSIYIVFIYDKAAKLVEFLIYYVHFNFVYFKQMLFPSKLSGLFDYEREILIISGLMFMY